MSIMQVEGLFNVTDIEIDVQIQRIPRGCFVPVKAAELGILLTTFATPNGVSSTLIHLANGVA